MKKPTLETQIQLDFNSEPSTTITYAQLVQLALENEDEIRLGINPLYPWLIDFKRLNLLNWISYLTQCDSYELL